MGFHAQSEDKQDAWPGGEVTFDILGMFFGILFTTEVLLKLAGMRRRFFRDPWNFLDTCIVALWLWNKCVPNVKDLPAALGARFRALHVVLGAPQAHHRLRRGRSHQ